MLKGPISLMVYLCCFFLLFRFEVFEGIQNLYGKTMEMLFCGFLILEIDVLVNNLGWEDGTRSTS